MFHLKFQFLICGWRKYLIVFSFCLYLFTKNYLIVFSLCLYFIIKQDLILFSLCLYSIIKSNPKVQGYECIQEPHFFGKLKLTFSHLNKTFYYYLYF